MALDDDAAPAAIEADITSMEAFAARLMAGVTDGYHAQLGEVTRRLQTPLPAGHAGFPELRMFLEAHGAARSAAYANAVNFRDGTVSFADAAQRVGDEYRGSDAFAQASVADVDNAFRTPGSR